MTKESLISRFEAIAVFAEASAAEFEEQSADEFATRIMVMTTCFDTLFNVIRGFRNVGE